MILRLGAEGHDRVGVHLASGVSDGANARAGEDVEAEIAASLGPFVGLLGEDAANEADHRVPVGEDADAVGSAADLSVQPLVGVVRPDLLPEVLGKRGEREDVCPGRVQVRGEVY